MGFWPKNRGNTRGFCVSIAAGKLNYGPGLGRDLQLFKVYAGVRNVDGH